MAVSIQKTVYKSSLLPLILILSGCVTSHAPSLKLNEADTSQEVISLIQDEALKHHEEQYVLGQDKICEAYLELNRFNEFFPCVEQYENKNFRFVYDMWDFQVVNHYPINSFGNAIRTSWTSYRARPSRLKTEAYFRLGDFHNTIKYGEIAIHNLTPKDGNWGLSGSEIDWQHPWTADTVATASMVSQAYSALGNITKAQEFLNIAEKYRLEVDGDEFDAGFARVRRSYTNPAYIAMGAQHKVQITQKSGSEYLQVLAGSAIAAAGATLTAASVVVGGTGAAESVQITAYGAAYANSAFLSDEDWLRERLQNARILEMQGALEQSLDAYNDVLADELISSSKELNWISLYGRANVHYQLNNFQAAEVDLTLAIDLIESSRGSLSTEALKIGYAGSKENVYQRQVEVLIKQGKATEAFNYAERAKARALVDMLADDQSKGQIIEGISSSDIPSVNNKNNALNDSNATPNKDSANSDTVRGLKKNRSKVSSSSSSVASLVAVDTVSGNELIQLLSHDETLVEYYELQNELVAFVVNQQGVKVFMLGSNKATENVKALRTAVKNKQSDLPALSKTLYQQLFAPLANNIKTTKLTIVAHGSLHYLPFNILHDGQDYLIESFTIRQLPSLNTLRYLDKPNTSKSNKLLVLGNPTGDLAGAEAEAKAIQKQYGNADLKLRGDATETYIKQKAQNYQWLHIASHGEFIPEDPLSSRLLLAGDASNNGDLTVRELYGLDLASDLVVLSACETGLGLIANGDDVIGLNRGFMYAGAQSIVSSLWLVDDVATQQLMQVFYKNLATQNKASALRNSQRHVKNKVNNHPFYWGAFQLTGQL